MKETGRQRKQWVSIYTGELVSRTREVDERLRGCYVCFAMVYSQWHYMIFRLTGRNVRKQMK
jgi:hypothetical protein